MPGPGNKKKPNKRPKNNANDEPAAGKPLPATQTPPAQCQTLEEDEMTRCDQPATEGYPKVERCKQHQKQYRIMYVKYKDAAKIVDELKNDIPVQAQIDQYKDISSLFKKARLIRKYVEAIRVERTGRQIHQTRFFLKADDGHKIRVKVLAKEMVKGIEGLDALHARAYHLYVAEDPLPAWAKHPGSDEFETDKPDLNAENLKDSFKPFPTTSTRSQGGAADKDEEDVIDLKLASEKSALLQCLAPFLDTVQMISLQLEILGLSDSEGQALDKLKYQSMMFQLIMEQYFRRIIFHDPVLFMKSLDKVSFKDFILSEDFSIEDMSRVAILLGKRLEFGLLWYKDAAVEALAIREARTAANVGDPGDRIPILGGWVFNRAHMRKITSNEAWYWAITTLEPPADVENRFIRICNTYDDAIGFLSFGALGYYPNPSFPKSKHGNAIMYRNHLSLAGVIICDMVSATKPPQLRGPVATTRRARQPGWSIWAEFQSRSYMFGALKDEPDAFQQAFLKELKARPDLFQVITRCESDPPRVVNTFGLGPGETEALPQMRSRSFEAPAASPQNPPQGFGQWEVHRSAIDVLYGTEDPIGGYIVTAKNWNRGEGRKTQYFFHHKKFPVTYFVIFDKTPNQHYDILAKQVAWAALRAKGYAQGTYEPHKYAISSDRFFDDCAKERLSWMPKCMGEWHATKPAG